MRRWVIVLMLFLPLQGAAQKLIQYTSGMGARDPQVASVWILYDGVEATHEGMTLLADSAHYDTERNSFRAFNNVVINISDTTHIYGRRLHYDGNERVLDIWDDTVLLVDGGTELRANHLTYVRDSETAFYTLWGVATSNDRCLESRQGQYDAMVKKFFISNHVRLTDSSMTLLTDTLVYDTEAKDACFYSPTYIYTDSSIIYSELGTYNTDTRFAVSYTASRVENNGRTIMSDTLLYDEYQEYGRAFGHVMIVDSLNDVTCTGRYGETHRSNHYSYVTDSAHVLFVDNGDSLFLHGDTVYLTTDSAGAINTVKAHHKVKMYRGDAQAMCDSLFYSAPDSCLTMYQKPVVWYEHYQCSADTIVLWHDTSGVRQVCLKTGCFAIQQVDRERFNQLKGRQGIVYFHDGEPDYADVVGNAHMVFYITEDDTNGGRQLLGVNAGVGNSMRIYFDSTRSASRVVACDKPDMQTYPVTKLPDELKRLQGFEWLSARRPKKPSDVYVW